MTTAAQELVCPVCESENVLPARPRILDRLVGLVGARPYWCEDCGERFRSTAPLSAPSESESPSDAERAVCPNCACETSIHLTRAEQQLAATEGWVVSCPDCRALFAFVRPAATP